MGGGGLWIGTSAADGARRANLIFMFMINSAPQGCLGGGGVGARLKSVKKTLYR